MQFVHPKWQKMLPLASSTAQPASQAGCDNATDGGGGRGSKSQPTNNNKLSTIEQLNEITSANREAPPTRRRMDGACRSLLCIALHWDLTVAYISSSIAFLMSCAGRDEGISTKRYVHFLNVQFHWNPFTSFAPTSSYPQKWTLLVPFLFEKLSQRRRGRRMVLAFTNK